MLFTTETIKAEELNSINNFFAQFENEFEAVKTVEAEVKEENSVTKYLHSLVTSQYQKSVEDIENTVVGNRIKRKRSLQQVMQESFFYGANRFGNNFIA
jgi:hypothetical protein